MPQTQFFRLGLSTAFRRTATAFTSTANPVLRRTIQTQAQPLLRSTPFTRTAFRSYRQQSKRHYSSSSASSNGSLSFTQRLKALSKEYGYTALGVYLLISALDFPVCFVAVRLIGADVVGEYEEKAVGWIRSVLPEGWLKKKESNEEEHVGEDGKKKTSIYTELALAYAVHKSLIFLRVPLTAAVLPKVVQVLRRWGWQVGAKGEGAKLAATTKKALKSKKIKKDD